MNRCVPQKQETIWSNTCQTASNHFFCFFIGFSSRHLHESQNDRNHSRPDESDLGATLIMIRDYQIVSKARNCAFTITSMAFPLYFPKTEFTYTALAEVIAFQTVNYLQLILHNKINRGLSVQYVCDFKEIPSSVTWNNLFPDDLHFMEKYWKTLSGGMTQNQHGKWILTALV